MIENKVGIFYIHVSWYREGNWEKLLDVFNMVIPYSIEMLFERSCFEVSAFSNYFEPIEDHEKTPTYNCSVELTPMLTIDRVSFSRLDEPHLVYISESGNSVKLLSRPY